MCCLLITVFLWSLLFVCLPDIIQSAPGSNPNIITSILSCNLLAISSTDRHCTGTAPTLPLPTPADRSIIVDATARSGGCDECIGFVIVVVAGFMSINYWIRDWTGIRFAFFAVFAVFDGMGKFASNPAQKTDGAFGARPDWMLPRQTVGCV
jgi:hypothetical protein